MLRSSQSEYIDRLLCQDRARLNSFFLSLLSITELITGIIRTLDYGKSQLCSRRVKYVKKQEINRLEQATALAQV